MEGLGGNDSYVFTHSALSAFLDVLLMTHREWADPGCVAWRQGFMKERANMWQQSQGKQTECLCAAFTGNI